MGKRDLIYEDFARFVSGLCVRTTLERDRPLFWSIIANPRAGGFTIRSRWKKHHTLLKEFSLRAEKEPIRPLARPALAGSAEYTGLILTEHKGHAASVTQNLIGEALGLLKSNPAEKPLFLVITAGGDGTSLEVLSSLYNAPEEALSLFAVLRLPMGTGNDGADARELDKALGFLTENPEIRFQRALTLSTSTPGKGPFPAFNILSIGLDAFVTHMTNKMKGNLPGDSYKLWVDLAALFYDRIYRVGFSDVRALDGKGKEIKAFREKLLLLAVGESGRRTYGSNKRILPDKRNVCAVRQMPLLRKLALKGLFSTGEHATQKESVLFSARRIEFSCEYPLLAQMDGETVLLEKTDFPAAIELSEPLLPVLGKEF
jgi:diacylglycerol kinase family enzyme